MTPEEEIKKLETLLSIMGTDGWRVFVEMAENAAEQAKDALPFAEEHRDVIILQTKHLLNKQYAMLEDTVKQTIDMIQDEMKPEDDGY